MTPEADALVETLLDAYRTAWGRVMDEQRAIALDPLAFRRRARLAEVATSIEEAMATVDQTALIWFDQSLSSVYDMGAYTGDPARDAAFAIANRDALVKLATDSYQNLLAATTHVTEQAKAVVRDLARTEITSGLIEGQTAVATATDLERAIRDRGINAVTYSNGATYGLDSYAEMVVRTVSAQAYNLGTLRGAGGENVDYFEVMDGPSCGWSRHDDADLADGSIRPVDECESYPLSHPSCRRAFSPRPDLNNVSPDQIPAYDPTATPEQTIAQIQSDIALNIGVGRTTNPRLSAEGRVQNVLAQREARIAARTARLAGVR